MYIKLIYISYIALWLVVWWVIGYLYGRILRSSELKRERQMSVKRSRSVILWEVYEKMLPILWEIPYNPKDMTFVGRWVDYIVFDGLAEWDLREIVFLEVKSGTSRLNKNEKMIQEVVDKKRVKYVEYRFE